MKGYFVVHSKRNMKWLWLIEHVSNRQCKIISLSVRWSVLQHWMIYDHDFFLLFSCFSLLNAVYTIYMYCTFRSSSNIKIVFHIYLKKICSIWLWVNLENVCFSCKISKYNYHYHKFHINVIFLTQQTALTYKTCNGLLPVLTQLQKQI